MNNRKRRKLSIALTPDHQKFTVVEQGVGTVYVHKDESYCQRYIRDNALSISATDKVLETA